MTLTPCDDVSRNTLLKPTRIIANNPSKTATSIRLSRDKHSSLLGRIVRNREKSFIINDVIMLMQLNVFLNVNTALK